MSHSDSIIGKCNCGGDIISIRKGSTFDIPFCDKCGKEYPYTEDCITDSPNEIKLTEEQRKRLRDLNDIIQEAREEGMTEEQISKMVGSYMDSELKYERKKNNKLVICKEIEESIKKFIEEQKLAIKNKEKIKQIQKDIEEIQNILNWYVERGGLLPYDWNDYFQPRWAKLKEDLKV